VLKILQLQLNNQNSKSKVKTITKRTRNSIVFLTVML